MILDVKRILGWVGGGVHKRIDENRELLELLRKEAPEVIAKNPWIVEWVQANDDFFTELEAAVPLSEGRFLGAANGIGSGFPRPWPGAPSRSPLGPIQTEPMAGVLCGIGKTRPLDDLLKNSEAVDNEPT